MVGRGGPAREPERRRNLKRPGRGGSRIGPLLQPRPPSIAPLPLPPFITSRFYHHPSPPPDRPPEMASASIQPTSLASALASFDSLSLSLPSWDAKTVASTAAVLVVTLLIAEQSLWRYRKGNLPGFSYQIVSPTALGGTAGATGGGAGAERVVFVFVVGVCSR